MRMVVTLPSSCSIYRGELVTSIIMTIILECWPSGGIAVGLKHDEVEVLDSSL